jgi:hypothetical protein
MGSARSWLRFKLLSDERIWGAAIDGFNRISLEPHRRFLLRADVADQVQTDMFRGDNHPGQPTRFAGRETLRSISLGFSAGSPAGHFSPGHLARSGN